MAEAKIFPKGVVCFDKHPNAPDFVIGSVVITPNDLNQLLRENESLMTVYKDKKQIKLQLLRNDKGLYFAVDTFKAKAKEDDGMPF